MRRLRGRGGGGDTVNRRSTGGPTEDRRESSVVGCRTAIGRAIGDGSGHGEGRIAANDPGLKVRRHGTSRAAARAMRAKGKGG